MNATPESKAALAGQAGGGILTVVALLGGILMLVQGTVYYRSSEGAKLLGSEKSKVLAMQMAEAGVEENVADLGKRITKMRAGLTDTVTYDHKALEGGHYSSRLTTVAVGDSADTVDMTSTGYVSKSAQVVRARLRLKKHLVANKTINPVHTPTNVVVVLDPATVPPIAGSPAFTACAGPNCWVCHIPPGNFAGRTSLNQPRGTIVAVHGGHQGDYITTAAAGCSAFNPVVNVVDVVTYDTLISNDTTVKVQILSWK